MSKTILIKPMVTEKLTRLMETQQQYTFEVARTANKVEIRKAIEDRYPGVKVASVRTMNVRGKTRTRNTRTGRITGRERAYKKAIISLREGEIDFFESV